MAREKVSFQEKFSYLMRGLKSSGIQKRTGIPSPTLKRVSSHKVSLSKSSKQKINSLYKSYINAQASKYGLNKDERKISPFMTPKGIRVIRKHYKKWAELIAIKYERKRRIIPAILKSISQSGKGYEHYQTYMKNLYGWSAEPEDEDVLYPYIDIEEVYE